MESLLAGMKMTNSLRSLKRGKGLRVKKRMRRRLVDVYILVSTKRERKKIFTMDILDAGRPCLP